MKAVQDHQRPAGSRTGCGRRGTEAGGTGALQPYEPTRTIGNDLTLTPRQSLPDLSTGYVTFGGLSAQCRQSNGASWLQVDADSNSPHDRSAVQQALGPTWGLHLLDLSNADGNLVSLVAGQAAAWR